MKALFSYNSASMGFSPSSLFCTNVGYTHLGNLLCHYAMKCKLIFTVSVCV